MSNLKLSNSKDFCKKTGNWISIEKIFQQETMNLLMIPYVPLLKIYRYLDPRSRQSFRVGTLREIDEDAMELRLAVAKQREIHHSYIKNLYGAAVDIWSEGLEREENYADLILLTAALEEQLSFASFLNIHFESVMIETFSLRCRRQMSCDIKIYHNGLNRSVRMKPYLLMQNAVCFVHTEHCDKIVFQMSAKGGGKDGEECVQGELEHFRNFMGCLTNYKEIKKEDFEQTTVFHQFLLGYGLFETTPPFENCPHIIPDQNISPYYGISMVRGLGQANTELDVEEEQE